MRCLLAFVTVIGLCVAVSAGEISWTKTVLDTKFRSEGVAVGDVDKDGDLDVMCGELWYEAPNWTPHEMQTVNDYGDGLHGYSHSFACWADDFNNDGYPDCIVIDFPGTPCYWLENPKGKSDQHWAKHEIWHSACNETPLYTDLLGNGQRVLIMAFQPKDGQPQGKMGQMAYFTPNAKDPTQLWTMHPISEPSSKEVEIPGTQRYSHGLGVGDVNGDGKLDVITSGAWWEQNGSETWTSWTMHPTSIKDASADMFALDIDGDEKADILHTSAHKYGIWWEKQRGGDFEKRIFFPKLISETHAAHLVDIDGDGLNDLVTGKRFWSHGKNEPGSDQPAMIYWFKAERGPDNMMRFTPRVIDNDSGIGTQFVVTDMNKDGLLDVVSSNKKGVRVILQQGK